MIKELLDSEDLISATVKDSSFQSLPMHLQRNFSFTFPKPKQKMKTLNWSKIPSTNVSGQSIWSEVFWDSSNVQVNFNQVEELFCQKSTTASSVIVEKNNKLKRKNTEIYLLDPKRSLNINIFLKQFKGGEKQLVKLIRNCQSAEIGSERLRTLLKILPECDEMISIKEYNGDNSKLGTAEKFYLLLSEVKAYNTRVQAMIQVEEFQPNVDILKPQIQHYIETCDVILKNKPLRKFLKIILITGNFINAGSYAGNAYGFRLNTLEKLMETRANKPRMTLLHYLVDIAEKEDVEILNFTNDLRYLSECSRLSVEGLTTEVNQLKSGVEQLDKQIQKNDPSLNKYFADFIKEAKEQLIDLSSGIEEIHRYSSRLALHFCENESTFKVEDCLGIFSNFCQKVQIARKENEDRRRQEARAERLKRERDVQKIKKSSNGLEEENSKDHQKKRGRKGRKGSPWSSQEECLIDMLLADIRNGDFQSCKNKAFPQDRNN